MTVVKTRGRGGGSWVPETHAEIQTSGFTTVTSDYLILQHKYWGKDKTVTGILH